MLFRQILHEDLGCASYVVACGGSAAVVDPQFDIEPYLELAAAQNLQVTDIVLTHNHADHVSGHGRLREATGATIHVSADAGAEYEHHGLRDGDTVTVGKVDLVAVATPGHRPEHMSFLVVDHARGEEPIALLSGDFIFVGDLARPDLAVEATEGARAIRASLDRLAGVPEYLEVWPGHVGGSLCGGAGMSRKPSSTIGYERAHNELLRCEAEPFVERLTSNLAPQPPNFRRIAERNRGPLLTEARPAVAMAPAAVAELQEGGAAIVDVRDPREFDAEHVPGSLNVTAASSGVGTRAAWFVEPEQPVVIVAGSDEEARGTVAKLQSAGLLDVRGWLAGGVGAWRAAGSELDSQPAIDPATLAERLRGERDDSFLLVDVRDEQEWRDGHVDGSVHAPFHRLHDGLPDALAARDRDAAVHVACSAGNRSALGASLLRREGFTNVVHVTDGGVADLADHAIQLTEGA